MIVLFTDFGLDGPYVGQMHAVLAQQAPGVPVIDLFHNVPSHDIRAGAFLLPAYARDFPPGTIFVAVVDPGVGSARAPLLVQADHRWYLGPDNGLFVPVVRRAATVEVRQISWRPPRLSASFHGRDLFAPVAAQLAHGRVPDGASMRLTEPDPTWPEDLAEVLYLDRFGNAITGLRAETLPPAAGLEVRGTLLARARTYADVAPGALFWHENSNGLAEIAAHGAPAAEILKIPIGQRVGVVYK